VAAPPTSLRLLAAVLRRAALFVGADSGPMHLAWGVGCPVLALFGPTDPRSTHPWEPPTSSCARAAPPPTSRRNRRSSDAEDSGARRAGGRRSAAPALRAFPARRGGRPVTPIDPATIRRVLVRANNWIGDVVMISPAVRALRAHFRGARIAILAKTWVLETLEGDPSFDDLIEYDSAGAHRGVGGRPAAGLLPAERAVRPGGAVPEGVRRGGAGLSGGDPLPGRLRRRPPLPAPDARPRAAAGGHASCRVFLGIARALGCRIDDPFPSFHLSEGDRRQARAILAATGLAGQAPLLAFHPGASKEPRAWHPERFAELGRRLTVRHGARVLLLGSEGERQQLQRIASRLPAECVLVPGPGLSMKVTGALLENCRLFVGNDSGPMHVAAALGVPTIGIFGPGTPRRTAPMAARGRVIAVSRDYPCSPAVRTSSASARRRPPASRSAWRKSGWRTWRGRRPSYCRGPPVGPLSRGSL